MEYSKARMRNLKIKLYKIKMSKGELLELSHTKEAINKKLFFKKSDINGYIGDFFNSVDENYRIKQEVLEELGLYFSYYQQFRAEREDLESLLKSNYKKIKAIYMNFEPTDNAEEIINVTKEIAAKLHWIYTPIYLEQTIINSGIIPEENTEEYYNNFHTIEDLYQVIFENGDIEWNSLEGDINLNSTIKLKIYSTRWGHDDVYFANRTLTGWNFKHLSYDVKCSKDGTVNGEKRDGLYRILEHDSIQYPYDGVKFALETLWEKADSSSMSTSDLEKQMQDIGDWINAVERATKHHQPKWINYY